MATRTSRIELGTAVVPLQAQHPVALARQALSAHAVADGRLALGVGPSHHWIVQDMLGLPYERPARFTRDYL
ncbi:LLM class flavin-dependent oxidoreductase, partial [Streptomyces sp. SID10244]|nr:LLM class flavin-dependent oxidoreductase [Streptomyces sp. SID10244]